MAAGMATRMNALVPRLLSIFATACLSPRARAQSMGEPARSERIMVSQAKPKGTTKTKAGAPRPGAERDYVGYGSRPPDPQWPGNARIAVNFCLNLETGGEHSVLYGDDHSEDLMNDIGFPAYAALRSPMAESSFEFGPRVGVWRALRAFKKFDVHASVMAVASGAQRYPGIIRACVADGHE